MSGTVSATEASRIDWSSYSLGLISGVAASALTAASQSWFELPAQQGSFLLGMTTLGIMTLAFMRCVLIKLPTRVVGISVLWVFLLVSTASPVTGGWILQILVWFSSDDDLDAHAAKWVHAAAPLLATVALAAVIAVVRTPRPNAVAAIHKEFAQQLMDGKTCDEAIVLTITKVRLRRRTVERVIERSIDSLFIATSGDLGHGRRVQVDGS
jgi:hypothetical protein